MSGQYPDVLPVVPLAKKVLLPSVVIKVILRGPEATILVRKHFQYQEHKQKTLYLGGIPFDPLDSKNTSPTSHSSSNTTAATSSSQEAPPVPLPAPGIRANDTKNKESDKSATSSGGEVAQLSSLLYDHGCLARILRIQRLGEGVFGVFLKGLARFKVENYIQVNQVFSARVSYPTAWQLREKVSTAEDDMIAFKALAREFVAKMRDLQIPQSLVQQLAHMVNTQPAPVMADMLMCIIETSYEEKLSILATFSVSERLKKASEWMTRQLHVLKISEQINSSVEGNLSKKQREFYLRQQLEEIKKELGNTSSQDASGKEDEDDLDALKRRIAEARLPNDALAVAQRELKRIQHLQPASTEYAVSRNYLELLAEMPWNRFTEDVLDIARARKQLDNDHFGLDHVKKRIIEYLSVVKIKGDLKAPIICFVGPPGVGKTSLGKSIAAALKRKFHRISLGGVRDEADMRGHRRTYVGAMPGLIIQGIRRCGVNNPVFLLDEVDKLAHSTIYGDPAAALLEILDPEQNNAFHDHYLNTSYDLSKVLFIATANTLETIPAPLLDRMEVIQLHGYTYDEKLHIARTHLLPKQIKHHGLAMDQIVISDRTLSKLAEEYTCESGVRNLERVIAAVVRGKCVQLAELYEDGREAEYTPKVTYNDIVDMFGAPTFEKEIAEREAVPGTVTGLAYSGNGNGGILIVEATKMPGKGDVRLTGSLGQVIQESAHIALSWIKAHAFELRIATHAHENITNHTDIHIHFPHGSVPKDGPSAGVTLACALVSLFSGQCVPTTTAMTGEISLRGQVLPVGGIKEKIVSAHRAGIRKIVLPIRNRKDVEADVPDSVKADVEFVYAKTIWDVLEAALLLSHRTEKRTTRSLESHL